MGTLKGNRTTISIGKEIVTQIRYFSCKKDISSLLVRRKTMRVTIDRHSLI